MGLTINFSSKQAIISNNMEMITRICVVLLVGVLLANCSTKNDSIDENSDSTIVVKEQVKKDTIADGPYAEKYPSGQVRIEGEIKNGARFGQWRAYYPDGTTQSEDYFEDGKKNGKTASFYKNGRLRYIGYFTWDKMSGMWEFYDTLGNVSTKKEYK